MRKFLIIFVLAISCTFLSSSECDSTEPFFKGFRLWPNPSNHSITIDIPASSGLKFLKLYDASGTFVVEVSLSPGRNTLELPRLHTGVYFYQTRGGPFVYRGKIVRIK